ncbi:MAG TPA: DMT family transporter [Acidimicrobiales bacterium]|nr:DMT family transporter [Acidimicrobiales bacterium]
MANSTNAAEKTRLPGLYVAGATAIVSGISVFVNSYGVKSFQSPAVYTTAKNLAATLVIAAFVALAWLATRGEGRDARRTTEPAAPTSSRPLSGVARLAGFAYVAAIGGGAAFILFFDGLARTSAVPAVFLHDTLVIWVALAALPLLGERLGPWNLAAIALLVVGVTATSGGVGHLVVDSGNALVLAATILWAIEAVIAKRLLAGITPSGLALVRMGGGAVVLVGYLGATGQFHTLVGLGGSGLRWALVTGCLLGGYVTTWMTALSRARAVDVTSVLVASAAVTIFLDTVVHHTGLASDTVGLVLLALGVAAVVRAWPRVARA